MTLKSPRYPYIHPMKIQNRLLPVILSLPVLLTIAHLCSGQVSPAYDLTWTTQSHNAGESMPCGGGDVGLNVWVEQNELYFYIARSGTFDENNAMLKLGRVRVKLTPNPFDGKDFRQQLKLNEGHVIINASNNGIDATLKLWVDVNNPVVHLDITSNKPLSTEAAYESWRAEDRVMRGKANNANAYKWARRQIVTYKDNITFTDNSIRFYHRNKNDQSVFDVTVKQQGLDSVKAQLYNPLHNLTFGGVLTAPTLRPAGTYTGKYQDTPFVGWKLASTKPARTHNLTVVLQTLQAESPEQWNTALRETQARAAADKNAYRKTSDWWKQYWQRSFIEVNPGKTDLNSPEWQSARNYTLFRYMLGCNAFGQWPTKFNGGLFTYDPVYTDTTFHFTPDHRNWGGGTFTAQNQRLVYFPMLRSGDTDAMIPQFEFYRRILANAELRSRTYWNHAGACFTEQMENFGLPNPTEYGWDHPATYDKGVEYNAWLEYEWDTVLEFCFMILETERYANRDITPYIPLVESCLTFFNEHYQYLAASRGRKSLDGSGKLVIYPGSACETYKMAYNPTPTLAALRTLLTRMQELPERYVSPTRKEHWRTMLNRIPELSLRESQGHKTIAPAKVWERINNQETPQLYPVYPWGLYGVGKPNLDLALNTWKYDSDAVRFRSHIGWKQDNIFAARLGLTEDAARLTVAKLKDSGRRFPAFWGPGFDWTPDHNWGGTGMIGLQEMLLQTPGDSIILFPAWPPTWDVHFKLNAPYNTIIEATLRNGKVESLIVTPASRRKDVVLSTPFKSK